MFQYLITIEPLGLLYGSAGRFLSPDNLVGRSGNSFPPSAVTLAGVFAHALGKNKLADLTVAGAFWAKCDNVQNFYVPTPQTYLVDKVTKQVSDRLFWHEGKWKTSTKIKAAGKVEDSTEEDKGAEGKFESGTWMAIDDWGKDKPKVATNPWEFLPHLHPKLCDDERRAYIKDLGNGKTQGGLFLENAVQLDPEVCLVYLSTEKLDDGWYRFGGEGHMVEIKSHSLTKESKINTLLNPPLDKSCASSTPSIGKSFALITPAVWGSNRLSLRVPGVQTDKGWEMVWQVEAMLCDRPTTYRYRRGSHLSRGRYAVPAGAVYVLDREQKPWHKWPPDWFPEDGDDLRLKAWGCGLALPLPLNVLSVEEAK